MEATETSGKHWLSNVEEPWLLIINNADDLSLELSSLFPEGERGHILVTTRNPGFKIHATVGSLEFTGLAKKDALLLLLRASDYPQPWDSDTEDCGNKITDTLGCLALALVHAGALIFQKICNIEDYLGFFNHFRRRINVRDVLKESQEEDRTVYATWEHSVASIAVLNTEASSDAIQMLSIVGFLHFENIRVNIFTRALKNRLDTLRIASDGTFISRMLQGVVARLQPPLILPDFLRDHYVEFDPSRIRHALNILRSFSLISYNSRDDSFSLHPVVHSWARGRLTRGEQALWAQTALNVLTQAVLLPPNDAGETHEEFRRDLLPHLDFCLKQRPIQILNYKATFGVPWTLIWRHSLLMVFRDQVLAAGKCGYVYAERGRFNDAVVLFSQAKDALVESRGIENEHTTRVMLALAGTCWGLGRLEEAVALQRTVVEVRSRTLGPEQPETLSAMDQLGRSFWLNGQYVEALELQTLTLQRMKAALGSQHVDTLSAMDNLGVTCGSWQKFSDSMNLHLEVLAARKKIQGPQHLDTLTTMNNLAMALKDLGSLAKAKELMTEVYEQRKLKLGREHPWTLWALCNLAKVHTELGNYQQAEGMLVPGIAAAKRSLNDDHLGVLMGIGELIRVYARQRRFQEAEQLSRHLIERFEIARGKGHPDTVYALSKIAHIYEDQGKYTEAFDLCQLADERVNIRLPPEHPMAKDISAKLQLLKQKVPTSRSQSHPEVPPVTELKKLQISKTF